MTPFIRDLPLPDRAARRYFIADHAENAEAFGIHPEGIHAVGRRAVREFLETYALELPTDDAVRIFNNLVEMFDLRAKADCQVARDVYESDIHFTLRLLVPDRLVAAS